MCLLVHAKEQGELVGVKVCRDAPPVTNFTRCIQETKFIPYPFFVDDSLNLKANEQNVGCPRMILGTYSSASGKWRVLTSQVYFSAQVLVLT